MSPVHLPVIIIGLALWACWLLLSGRILGSLGFFSGEGLRHAPPRDSQFTLLYVAAVAFLYLSMGLLILLALRPARTAPPELPKNPLATQRAAATRPATETATRVAAASAPATSAGGGEEFDVRTFTISQLVDVSVRLVLAVMMLLLARQLVVGGLRGFGFYLGGLPGGILLGLLAAFLLVPWMAVVQTMTAMVSDYFHHAPPLHPILKALTEAPSSRARLVLVFSAVIAAPFTEELFFRGLLQTTLLRFLPRTRATRGFPVITESPVIAQTVDTIETAASSAEMGSQPPATAPTPAARWIAILVTSVLFALIHFDGSNPEVLPIIFCLAVALGYLYERTGNLFASITLHACFNAFSTTLILLSHG